MKAFLDDDFLLTTPTARRLYQVARSMPILDYHCHLDPKEIAQDRRLRTSPRCGWAAATTSGA